MKIKPIKRPKRIQEARMTQKTALVGLSSNHSKTLKVKYDPRTKTILQAAVKTEMPSSILPKTEKNIPARRRMAPNTFLLSERSFTNLLAAKSGQPLAS